MSKQDQQQQEGELQPLVLPRTGESVDNEMEEKTKFGKKAATQIIVFLLLFVFAKNVRYDRKQNKFDEDDEEGNYSAAYGVVNVDFDIDQYDIAYVNLMRHGEKDFGFESEHLSQIGYDRAKYYANCMTTSNASSYYTETFPKPLGSLMSQLNATITPPYKGNIGLSQRSTETLQSLSQVTGIPIHKPCKMTDLDCFVSTILTGLIQPNQTVLVSWEHKLFPELLRLLLTQGEDTGVMTTGMLPKSIVSRKDGQELLKKHYGKWPEKCDAQSWKNPRVIKDEKIVEGKLAFPFHNACFDRVWQIQYIKLKTEPNLAKYWVPINVRSINNGYGGSKNSPCEEGLKPISLP